jgi:redox-sensitive bicupin YhaK (pirin superfamily)
MVDFHLNAGAEVSQELPAGYRGFLYAVSGSVTVHGQQLSIGQVGFFEEAPGAQSEPTELRFVGGPRGARFVLYAGQPQREPCIQYGPFVAQDMDAIQRLNEEFRKGGFVRLSQLGGVA